MSKQRLNSDELEYLVLERAPQIDAQRLMDTTMSELAVVAMRVLGVRVTFEEEGGPGGVISDICIHWDTPVTIGEAAGAKADV
jgi:hypothetical protein